MKAENRGNEGCLQKDSVEREGYAGARRICRSAKDMQEREAPTLEKGKNEAVQAADVNIELGEPEQRLQAGQKQSRRTVD